MGEIEVSVDPIYPRACEAVADGLLRSGFSIGRFQEELKVGYNRAIHLLVDLEKNGVIEPIKDKYGSRSDAGHWLGRYKKVGMKNIYIFDIDGTIALIDHRRYLVDRKVNPNPTNDDWREFYSQCDADLPNNSVIQTMELLKQSGAKVLFFSGRSAEVRGKTIKWLSDNTSFCSSDFFGSGLLTMRDEGDFTPDHELKEKWLNGMLEEDRRNIVAVFDDRRTVVNMWRRNNVDCFQVAEGDF